MIIKSLKKTRIYNFSKIKDELKVLKFKIENSELFVKGCDLN